jgi:hypothetical protein
MLVCNCQLSGVITASAARKGSGSAPTQQLLLLGCCCQHTGSNCPLVSLLMVHSPTRTVAPNIVMMWGCWPASIVGWWSGCLRALLCDLCCEHISCLLDGGDLLGTCTHNAVEVNVGRRHKSEQNCDAKVAGRHIPSSSSVSANFSSNAIMISTCIVHVQWLLACKGCAWVNHATPAHARDNQRRSDGIPCPGSQRPSPRTWTRERSAHARSLRNCDEHTACAL